MSHFKLLILLLIVNISFDYISAQSLSIEEVLSSPFPTNIVAAPVGDRLAWVFNREGKRNIWVAEGPSFQGRMITAYQMDDGQSIGNLQFSPDGNTIIFVRGGAPNRKGEIPNPTSSSVPAKREIYSIPFSGGSPQLIAEGSSPKIAPNGEILAFISKGQVWHKKVKDEEAPKKLFQIRGSANSLRWSPNKNKPMLAFVSARGDHNYIGIYDFESQEIQYLNPSVDRDANPVWSPDGNQLAFIRMPNQKQVLPFTPRRSGLPWSILVSNLKTQETKTIWTAQKGVGSNFRFISADNQLFWSADNQIIFPWEGDGWTHLYKVRVNGGAAVLLTPGEFEVQFASLSPDGKSILYSSNQNDIDRQHIWEVEIEKGLPSILTPGKGIEWSPVMTAQNRVMVCLASSGVQPAHPYYLSNDKLKPLSDLPESYPIKDMVEPEQVVFSAADGMQIHGQLFKPKDLKEGDKRPAVLFFHGGSRRQMLLGFHHRGYYHNAYAMNQYLANQGYIVLSVNYRSGIGYGMKFREALNYGAQGASEFNDVLGAGLYLRNRSDVDSDKIGLWGGSYGGYLTALGLAKASNLFAAGVDIHGVHDWNVVINNFVPSYKAGAKADFAQLAFESSPMAYIKDWKSPVLIIHGDDDRNVPFSESVDLAESLRRQEVYFEQLIFPDEVHGFLLHSNWVKAYEATADFFDRMLVKP